MPITDQPLRRTHPPGIPAGVVIGIVPLSLAAAYALVPAARSVMTREDGLIEWISAGMFLAAAVVGFAALMRARRPERWSWLLPVAGLVGFGEETAYGARVVGFPLPRFGGEPVDSLHDGFDILQGLLADAGIRQMHAAAALAAGAIVLAAVAARRGWLRRATHWLRAHEAVAFVAAAVAVATVAVAFDLLGSTAGARLVEELLEVAAAGILVAGALRLRNAGAGGDTEAAS